jgi:glyoxylase-like metal-dependent hydrolase (beta-lactamase superfamily II)
VSSIAEVQLMITAEPIAEIHSGLYKIELPLPIRPTGVQVYFFDKGRQSVLIDTGLGTEESLAALHDALQEIHCELSDIAVTICTHYHPDHYGASLKIKQVSGCDVLMHKADSEYLLRSLLLNTGDYRRFLTSHGIPVDGHCLAPPAISILREHYMPAVPDKYLADGEQLTFGDLRLEAIWTPGHSPGHVALYWREAKIFISGDHLLPHITPHVGIHSGMEGDPLNDYLASVRRLEKLEIDQVLPAHGPCFGDHRARIREIFRHHEKRQQDIIRALADGPMTAYELALELFDASLPALHKEIAAYEILAHLELMTKIGTVRFREINSVVRYAVGVGR